MHGICCVLHPGQPLEGRRCGRRGREGQKTKLWLRSSEAMGQAVCTQELAAHSCQGAALNTNVRACTLRGL
jgi:hypothetical protein